ncbi:MAG: YfdX family protein [Candidatus Omnitrophica bacterium]|nr:YfdX family protein [Candidatus Omnitrophota bacterium]MCB9721902.1 YfdX family protein [Candidatus Omnitrophota bacterium]
MKTFELICAISILLTGLSPQVAAAQNPEKSDDQRVSHAVQKKKTEELERETARIVDEAVDGIKLTRTAYQLLEEDKPDEAKDEITRALGKINAAIAANPELTMLPVQADVQIMMGINDLTTAMQHKAAAQDVLAMENVQAARALLAPMVDEVDVEVLSVPVLTYKNKLNAALGLLENGEKWEARRSLREALSMFVIDTEVIPIPTITAEALIDEAIVAEKTDRAQAVKLLQEANDALTLSAVLGYNTDADNDLRAQIHSQNKKLSRLKHEQMKEEMLSKINGLQTKIKNSASEWKENLDDQIGRLKDKLGSSRQS